MEIEEAAPRGEHGTPPKPEKVRQRGEREMANFKMQRATERGSEREREAAGRKEGRRGDEVWCLLVAQEFASEDPQSDLFASTSPLFAARLLVFRFVSRTDRGWTVMSWDIGCGAFLHAPVNRNWKKCARRIPRVRKKDLGKDAAVIDGPEDVRAARITISTKQEKTFSLSLEHPLAPTVTIPEPFIPRSWA